MLKIGLIDVDGYNFPNLALMKISTYHKQKGDFVEWYPGFDFYDIVYMSKVFTFTPDDYRVIQADKVIKGGTGYDITSVLPDDIENVDCPDYSIYPMHNFSIEFFSRGCIRNCSFCLVRQKEGKIRTVKPLKLNPKGKYIDVLDNNFFANKEWRFSVDFLNETKQPVNLSGVDVRIMNEEQALALNSMKLSSKRIHIAWDNAKDDILPNLKEMVKVVKNHKITCYVLIGFDSTPEEDYYRVMKLKELGISPFVQPFRDYNNKRVPSQYEKDFAGWVNLKKAFNTCDFRSFSPRKGFSCGVYLK